MPLRSLRGIFVLYPDLPLGLSQHACLWNVGELHVCGTYFVREASSYESDKVSALKFSVFLEDLNGVVYEFLFCISNRKWISVDIIYKSHFSHSESSIAHGINRYLTMCQR